MESARNEALAFDLDTLLDVFLMTAETWILEKFVAFCRLMGFMGDPTVVLAQRPTPAVLAQ